MSHRFKYGVTLFALAWVVAILVTYVNQFFHFGYWFSELWFFGALFAYVAAVVVGSAGVAFLFDKDLYDDAHRWVAELIEGQSDNRDE